MVCCDACPKSFHIKCVPELRRDGVPDGDWFCHVCVKLPRSPTSTSADTEASSAPPARVLVADLVKHAEDAQARALVLGGRRSPVTGVSLLMFLQYAEIVLPRSVLLRVVRRAAAYAAEAAEAAEAEAPAKGAATATRRFICKIAVDMGAERLLDIVREFEEGRASDAAHGFGTPLGFCSTTSSVRHDVCLACGEVRVLRTICVSCCAEHAMDLAAYVPTGSGRRTAALRKKYTQQLERTSGAARTSAAVDAQLRVDRLASVARGLDYFSQCSYESPALFKSNGGDMLFLAHKLRVIVQRCVGVDSVHGRHALRVEENIARRWVECNSTLAPNATLAEILGTIEAMHVLRRLFDEGDQRRFDGWASPPRARDTSDAVSFFYLPLYSTRIILTI